MISQLQTNNSTFYGRYWTETNLLRRYLATDQDVSILSFGCSTGEELLLLRKLFPAARLFGCDYDWSSLLSARALLGRDAVIYDSGKTDIARHGPFDIIVCNSVLLSHTVHGPDGQSALPAEAWLNAVTMLDAALKPGGVLQIINSNIPFRLHPLATQYTPLRSPLILGPNFVDQFDLEGRFLCAGVSGAGITAMLNVHLGADHWPLLRPEDLTDVHFQKAGGVPIAPVLDHRLPNMANPPARASGTMTFRSEALVDPRPATSTEIAIDWSSVGVEGVRIHRTARRVWFDGVALPDETTVIEMQGPLASAFLESAVGRPSMRLTMTALEAQPVIHSPIF
jgi:SAM-dependent methyltransferase